MRPTGPTPPPATTSAEAISSSAAFRTTWSVALLDRHVDLHLAGEGGGARGRARASAGSAWGRTVVGSR